jgi:hypothetical protein
MDLEAARGGSCIKVEKKGRGRNGEGEGVSGWARAKREGRGGGCRVRRACSSEGSDSRQLHASGGGGQRHGRHETGEAVPLSGGPR